MLTGFLPLSNPRSYVHKTTKKTRSKPQFLIVFFLFQPKTLDPTSFGYYSRVLFTIAHHHDLIDVVEADLKKFQSILSAYPLVRQNVRGDELDPEALQELLTGLKLADESTAIIQWLAAQRVMNDFDRIVDNLAEIIEEETGIIRGTITVGRVHDAQLKFLISYIKANHLKPGQNLSLSLKFDPTLGPGVKYEVGSFSADDTVQPKLDTLLSRHLEHVQEEVDTQISSLKNLEFQSPKSDEEKISDALHHASNTGFDWRRVQEAADADGKIDWKKLPDLRK